jgi:predicted nicotinamide N-methyase
VTTLDALPAELAALDGRFEMAQTDIALGDKTITLLHPKDYDDLISEADFVRDDRLPYWCDIWPSSIALARAIPTLVREPCRTLELGCGLGLVTLAALRAGHDVLSTDYYDDALLFTRRNSRASAGREPAVRHVDWRHWPDDVGRFDLVLASDVLYEESYAALIATALKRSLTPEGLALVADPGRAAFGTFVSKCLSIDLKVRERVQVPHDDGVVRQVITIHEIRRDSR